MAKYNISIANLKGNANKQPEFSYASCVGRSYRFKLAQIIADNYGVKLLWSGKMVAVFTATPQTLQLLLRYTNGCGMLFTVWLTVIKQRFGNKVTALKVYTVVLYKVFNRLKGNT